MNPIKRHVMWRYNCGLYHADATDYMAEHCDQNTTDIADLLARAGYAKVKTLKDTGGKSYIEAELTEAGARWLLS
ncbi:MAG: hypothetical protein F4Z28_02100 [Gammaproteobacteria bacterium]|nr:hypothetical protein [Gammaproteobacteria bacterium]